MNFGAKRMSYSEPSGRTKKAYARQPLRLKWKCDRCDGARAAAKRNGDKEIPEEVSFGARADLEAHRIREHAA